MSSPFYPLRLQFSPRLRLVYSILGGFVDVALFRYPFFALRPKQWNSSCEKYFHISAYLLIMVSTCPWIWIMEHFWIIINELWDSCYIVRWKCYSCSCRWRKVFGATHQPEQAETAILNQNETKSFRLPFTLILSLRWQKGYKLIIRKSCAFFFIFHLLINHSIDSLNGCNNML